MFGLFGSRPRPTGTYSIKVYQPQREQISIAYTGGKLKKAEGLYARGLFAAKVLYDAKDPEFTVYLFAEIAGICKALDENRLGADTALSLLVPDGRAMVQRYLETKVEIVHDKTSSFPYIGVVYADGVTVHDLLVAVPRLFAHWLIEHEISKGTFSALSLLQFLNGFLSYYHEDPIAFLSPESTHQAAAKGYVWANASALGMIGLTDE